MGPGREGVEGESVCDGKRRIGREGDGERDEDEERKEAGMGSIEW